MRSTLLLLLSLLSLAVLNFAPSVNAAEGSALSVRWRGKSWKLDKLPQDLPPPARAAIDAWSEWAKDGDYRMDLEQDGRVLLVSPARSSRWRGQMKLVSRTIEFFDAALPLPDRSEAPAPAPAASGNNGGPLPEDPDDGPLPEDPEGAPPTPDDSGTTAWTWTNTWGTEGVPLDTETVVLFVLRTERDYADMLERLAEHHLYLREWAASATNLTGFVLEQPLAGAYIEAASGQEEWNPDNEVVNRLAQLLMVRRFGQLPYWLVQGWAWYAELKLLKAIYCFPYRNEFVYETEHTSWRRDLATRFKSRRKNPLKIEEFADWKRGRYDGEKATPSWGTVEFLARHRPDAFRRVVEELRLFREADNRVDHENGTWERSVEYTIPIEVQERILEEHAGDDFFPEATAFFRLGNTYRGE